MEIRWYTFLTSSIYTMYGSVQRERNALEKKKKKFLIHHPNGDKEREEKSDFYIQMTKISCFYTLVF